MTLIGTDSALIGVLNSASPSFQSCLPVTDRMGSAWAEAVSMWIRILMLAAQPVAGGPVTGIHWDWSPEVRLIQQGPTALQEQVTYEAFSRQFGQVWGTDHDVGSIGLRYTRRSVTRHSNRAVQGPFPHDLYSLARGGRWSGRWASSHETEM